jgi:hypothetical protein
MRASQRSAMHRLCRARRERTAHRPLRAGARRARPVLTAWQCLRRPSLAHRAPDRRGDPRCRPSERPRSNSHCPMVVDAARQTPSHSGTATAQRYCAEVLRRGTAQNLAQMTRGGARERDHSRARHETRQRRCRPVVQTLGTTRVEVACRKCRAAARWSSPRTTLSPSYATGPVDDASLST